MDAPQSIVPRIVDKKEIAERAAQVLAEPVEHGEGVMPLNVGYFALERLQLRVKRTA